MLQEREIEDTQSPLRTLHDELSEKIIAETGSENEDAVNVIIKSQLNRGADLTKSEQTLLDTPVMQKIVNDSQDLFRKASDSTVQAWNSMYETAALTQKNKNYDTFDTTDDGLTYINGQNTPVEYQGVTAITGDDFDVRLRDGSTVKASELNYGDPSVPAILSGMLDAQKKHGTQMSPEFVDSAVKLWQEGGYNSGSLNGFIADAQEAFYAGNSNNTEYKPRVMSQTGYDALYKAAAETKSAAITTKGTQIEANITATRREGAVLFESADGTNVNISSSRDMARQGIHLNDLQKVGIDMVTNLSKSTGLTFRFFQSERNSDGVYVSKYSKESNGKQKASPNGFYKNGEIYVDINAGSNGEGLIMFTVSHELVHFMRDFAPEQFDKFAGFLFASYAKKGLSVRHAVHQEMMAHQSLKYDEAYEEVVARLSESFLRDAHLSEKSKALYNADKSLWQSIKDGLEKVINKIKESFADIAPESQLGKIGQKMVRENQDILDRFVAGIRAAADNASYTENTTGEGGVRYMARDFKGERNFIQFRDKEAIGKAVQDTKDTVISNGMEVIIDDMDIPNDVDWTDAKEGREYIKSILTDALGKDVDLGVDSQSITARLTREGLNHALKGKNDDQKASIYNYFIALAGSSLYSYSTYQDTEHSKASSAINNNVQWDSFVAVANYKGKQFPVVFVVRSIDSDLRGQIYESWIKKETKAAHDAGTQSESANGQSNYDDQLVSNPIISDSSEKGNTSDKKTMNQSRDDDYLSAVNRGDMETAQRMVDEAAERAFADSKIRGEDGKLVKVYHGTDADFTVFDRTMGRSNMDIQGLFFSPWDIDAGGYGPNVRAFYLNITNPADESTGYKALNAHKGENYVGIKAREDLEKAGYDGVNNSDEEYIAFTSEQIKSADPVTYDDKGKVIQLSERFNSEEKDIRYQERGDQTYTQEEVDEYIRKEREAADERIQKVKDHNKELRKNERERRKKTEFRHKVKNMINGFNTMLNHPVEGKYIPRQFISQTVDFLKMINLDSGRSVNLSDKLAKLADKYKELKDDNDNFASYDIAVEQRMTALSEMIEEEAKAWVPKRNKAIQYENKRRQREGKNPLKKVTEDNFSIQNMSLELLQYTHDTLKSIQHIIRDSLKMTGEETKKNRVEVHKTLVQEICEVRKPHSGYARFYKDLAKSGYLMFKSFADYKKNSEWENRQNELNIGCIKRADLGLKLSKPFEALIDDTKSFDKMIKTTVDIGLKDSDGNPVPITHDMLVCVYLDLLNSHNTEHVVGGGYHVPDLKEYHKGKIKQSYQGGSVANGVGIYAIDINQRKEEVEQRLNQAVENGEDTAVYERQIKELDKEAKSLKNKVEKYFTTIKSNVLANMTDYDRAWAKAWQDFNKMASEEINKTTLELYGFKKAVVENYFPITVDQVFRSPTFDNIVMDMSLENWGSLKERVKGARGTILLQGISNVVAERIEKTSLFCGMAIPMRNFQKVYGVVTYDFSKGQDNKSEIQTTIQRELDKKFGDSAIGGGANTYIKKLLGDLTITETESTPMDKLMSLVRNGIAVKTLTLNPRVWFTQAASYVTALPEVDIVSLAKGLGTIFYKVNPHWSAKFRKHIATVTPLYDLRRAGMSTPELGDLSKARSKNPVSRFRGKTQKITNLTQFNDSITTGRLWYVAEFYIQRHTNLERGTVEFDKAVAEKYNKILQRTQPNYTPMERAQILRSKNAITKSFTMWKTQRLQNVNILMDAYGSFNKTLRDCNRHMNGATAADVGKAFVTCIKATIGVLASQFMIEAVSAAVSILLYHSFKKFTGDDDDEMTFGSIMNGIWKNYLSSLLGNFIGGSEIESIMETIKDGKRWSPIEPGVLETVLDLANDTMDTVNVFQENGALSAKFATAVHDRIVDSLGFFGIAAKNAEKIYNGITLWIEDWTDKDIFQFTEIGDRVNQALMERTIQQLKDGDFHKMNNLAQDKYNEAYDKAWNKGKSEDECVSAGDSAAKSFIASTLRDEYVKAYKSNDIETAKAIRKYMHQTGYYKIASGKKKGTVSAGVADKVLDNWIEENKKKQEEAETAKERKGE
ncbi:MAG: hypothetical protein IJ639_08585 [Ruminococcus sp.]|nr:hypothetical protein [Ruminococcus sp.]